MLHLDASETLRWLRGKASSSPEAAAIRISAVSYIPGHLGPKRPSLTQSRGSNAISRFKRYRTSRAFQGRNVRFHQQEGHRYTDIWSVDGDHAALLCRASPHHTVMYSLLTIQQVLHQWSRHILDLSLLVTCIILGRAIAISSACRARLADWLATLHTIYHTDMNRCDVYTRSSPKLQISQLQGRGLFVDAESNNNGENAAQRIGR